MTALVKSATALAALLAAGAANALVITPEPGSNLAAFDYVVDEGARTIQIFETFGPETATQILLRFEGFDFGRRAWTVTKTVTNETGMAWESFSHELLQADLSGSEDNDGLSFAQFGSPLIDRSSDLFATVAADEEDERDYLLFLDGLVAAGSSVSFSFGLAAFRETDQTSTFYLRQSEFLDVVPEPATWAMLITGFGLVGFAMRRRSRGMASVTA